MRSTVLTKDSYGNKMYYVVQKSDSKQVIGMRLHVGKKANLSDKLNTLVVRGNFDHLKQIKFYSKQIEVSHPIDKEYKKKMCVLTDTGKKRLKTLRILKNGNLPFWEYMYKKQII